MFYNKVKKKKKSINMHSFLNSSLLVCCPEIIYVIYGIQNIKVCVK